MASDPFDPSVTAALRAWRVQHGAGVPVAQALATSATVCASGTAQASFAGARAAAGGAIDDVLAALRPVLSEAERALLAAGWKSGHVERVLDALATQREQWAAARSKVRSGLVLPLAVLLLAAFVAPLPDFISGGSAGGYIASALAPLAVAGVVWFAVSHVLRSRAQRSTTFDPAWAQPLAFDKALLALPLAGEMERQRNLAEFATLLGLFHEAGMPITQALELCARAAVSSVYAQEIMRCAGSVRQGLPLSSALQARPLWPPGFVAAVVVGEKSGALDTALARLGQQAREEYGRSVARLASWIPKLVYACIALFVIYLIVQAVGALAGFYRSVGG